MRPDKKGVSPVIATVLLIVIGVVLAGIIFTWSRSVIPENILKDGEPIERACDRVNFQANVATMPIISGQPRQFLDVNNRGNVEIYGIAISIIDEGSVTSGDKAINTTSIGKSTRTVITSQPVGTKLRLTPILLGLKGEQEVVHECLGGKIEIIVN